MGRVPKRIPVPKHIIKFYFFARPFCLAYSAAPSAPTYCGCLTVSIVCPVTSARIWFMMLILASPPAKRIVSEILHFLAWHSKSQRKWKQMPSITARSKSPRVVSKLMPESELRMSPSSNGVLQPFMNGVNKSPCAPGSAFETSDAHSS